MEAGFPPIEYIGVESLTTSDHYEIKLKRVDIDADTLTKPMKVNDMELLPLHTWYDKTHIARTDTYKQLLNIGCPSEVKNIFGLTFPLGSFIEDVFFNSKIPSYPKIGTYVLKQNLGPIIYHLSGRKLALNDSINQQTSSILSINKEN